MAAPENFFAGLIGAIDSLRELVSRVGAHNSHLFQDNKHTAQTTALSGLQDSAKQIAAEHPTNQSSITPANGS